MGLLLAAGLALRDRWDAVGDVGGPPGALPVAVAVLLNVAGNALLAHVWRELAAVRGTRLGWRTASWVWAVSQLGRYGMSGAQVAGRAVVARRHGLSATAGGLTALVEVAWQVAIHGVVVLATLPWWLPGADGLRWVAVAGVLPAGVLVAGTVAPRRLLRALQRVVAWGPVARLTRGRLGTAIDGIAIDRRRAARLTALFVLNTGVRFAAFATVLAAVGGAVPEQLPRAAGAYVLGQFVGRLAVFAPGGIGPREGVTALVMGPVLGGTGAVVLVAVTRLVEVAGELVFLGLTRLWRPRPAGAAVTGDRGRSS